MGALVEYETRREIAVLWVDNPPVNAISAALREELGAALKAADADAAVRAIVIACRGRTFMAGADIKEFGSGPKGRSLSEVIEEVGKPVVAALHGTALGGGFETALACDHRVAAPGTVVGLPEVKLGMLPGGGGTQRLPRLVGIERAIEVLLSGEPIPDEAALEIGAIDRIITGDLADGAVDFALAVSESGLRRLSAVQLDPLPAEAFAQTVARATRRRQGETAPARIVACIEAATRLPFAAGLAFEREQCNACLADPQSAALRHAFFAERQARRVPGLDPAIRPRPVASAGVVGAGTMGGGIAMCFADAGIPVVLIDATQDGLDRGVAAIRRSYERSVANGRLTQAEAEARLGLIRPTLAYDDLGGADFIVEAVFETAELKHAVFAELDWIAKPGVVLASNTSRLSIDAMAGATNRPGDVVGIHFFSPANVMRLSEVVRGPRTSPEALATALAVAAKIGKVGVVAGDSNGFIGNRMLGAAVYQTIMAVLEGAAPEQVDRAIERFGMKMGPFRVADLAGLDVGCKSRKNYPADSLYAQSGVVADRLCELGRYGQKTGTGYYDYIPGDRSPIPSALVRDVIREVADSLNVPQRETPEHELAERYLLGLVNEGCEVLREGVAYRAGDIDVVYLTGYGFPAWRGGPLYWAEKTLGLPTALARIRDYSARTLGGWLRPSSLLERAVAEGLTLDEAARPSEEPRCPQSRN